MTTDNRAVKVEQMAAKHEMWVDEKAKVFHIDLYGFYGVDDAAQFFVDYEKYTAPLDKSVFSIVIDCVNLSTFKPDILPYLREAYKAYNEFKSVHFINSPTPVGQMQLKRIAREVNLLDRFEFANSAADLHIN